MATTQAPASHSVIPPRRSVTVPARLQRQSLGSEDVSGAENGVETLYVHPQTKIVSFSATATGRPSSSSGWGTAKEAGTVSWTSVGERVKAAGPLKLYRLPSSAHVVFLHSGDQLLSLLPRSQCWCVDGVSKFAMCIQLYIYRIELPHETDEDKQRVEEFKTVLGKILYYERTPCPFKRGFEQGEAEELPSPIAKRPRGTKSKARKWERGTRYWRPEGEEDWVPYRNSGSPGESDEDGHSVSSSTDNATSVDTPGEEGEALDLVTPLQPDLRRARVVTEPLSITRRASLFNQTPPSEQQRHTAPRARGPIPANSMTYDTTSPPYRDHPFSPPLSDMEPFRGTRYTPASPPFHHNMPFSPASADFASPKTPTSARHTAFSEEKESYHLRDASTATITPSNWAARPHSPILEHPTTPSSYPLTPPNRQPPPASIHHEPPPPFTFPTHTESPPVPSNASISPPKSPTLDEDSLPVTVSTEPADEPPSEAGSSQASAPVTPPSSSSRRRTASPRSHQRFRSTDLPAYVRSSSASPTRPNLALASLNPSTGLVSKTCALLLGPPSGLVQIMIQIASRLRAIGAASVADGGEAAWSLKGSGIPGSGSRGRRGPRGRSLPGGWESSDDEAWDDLDEQPEEQDRAAVPQRAGGPGESEEDDFGVPLGCGTPARARRKMWGVDS